jgi:dihydrofolate reductase
VFVLTHHPRPPLEMQGGTTFHFVDGGIEVALQLATEAADGGDVLIGGGAETVRQYLAAGLIDDMHLVLVPVLLGAGERLFEDLDLAIGTYECVEHVCSPAVTHVRFVRSQ